MPVPEELPDGRYVLHVGGGPEADRYTASRLPARFRVVSLEDAWQRLGHARRSDALHLTLWARAPEVNADGEDLPELPTSALAVLGSPQQAGDRARRGDWAMVEELRRPLDRVVRGGTAVGSDGGSHCPLRAQTAGRVPRHGGPDMQWATRLTLFTLAVVAAVPLDPPAPARAAETQWWTQNTAGDHARSNRGCGRGSRRRAAARPARRLVPCGLAGVAWCAVVMRDGSVVVGADRGRVMRWSERGGWRLFSRLDAGQVLSLAVDGDDVVAGTGPARHRLPHPAHWRHHETGRDERAFTCGRSCPPARACGTRPAARMAGCCA
jgi:hypothetical protein